MCVYLIKKKTTYLSQKNLNYILISALFILFCTALGGFSDYPNRWIKIFGFSIYSSSVLIPSVILLFVYQLRSSSIISNWNGIIYILFAFVLAVQPDLSQTISYSISMSISLLLFKRLTKFTVIILSSLIACCIWAWSKADPLLPIIYVEGVLRLSLELHFIVLLISIISLLIPIGFMLNRYFNHDQNEFLSVSLYYVSIILFGGLNELTPIPLLGFGAGPILGYYVLIYISKRLEKHEHVVK